MPILDTELFTTMVKLSNSNYMLRRRLIDFDVTRFSNWNLSQINLSEIEDQDLIDELNNAIMKRFIGPKFTKKVDFFSVLFNMGGMYGIDGFHPGFADMMVSLLYDMIIQEKRSKESSQSEDFKNAELGLPEEKEVFLKQPTFLLAMARAHYYGIKSPPLNITMR